MAPGGPEYKSYFARYIDGNVLIAAGAESVGVQPRTQNIVDAVPGHQDALESDYRPSGYAKFFKPASVPSVQDG